MNRESPDVQDGIRKVEESEIKLQHPSDHQKSKSSRKTIYFYFIDYAKAFDRVDHNKQENS